MNPGPLTPLLKSFHNQDEIFRTAFAIVQTAIAEHAFPCASLAVTYQSKLVGLKSFGRFVFPEDLNIVQAEPLSVEASPSTPFDLASVTKAVATTTMAMILYERGLLQLDAPISGVVPEFLTNDPRRRQVTFRTLLAHSSGLPAYEKLFLRTRSRDELLAAAFATTLTTAPGTRAEYSDLGFIILAVALERLAGEPIDGFCQREVFSPLGMSNTTFNPAADLRPKIPPTADERQTAGPEPCADAPARAIETNPRSTFRNRIVQGEVQDENAFVLGGVAGHAGLFSTAEDVARFAHAMLKGGGPILRRETIALFTQRESSPVGTSRALGWDTPSAPSQSGKYFAPNSYGHLGYTGTSLWIDPDRKLSITLLTNRTWPDCANQAIKQMRPRIHDAIVEALDRPS